MKVYRHDIARKTLAFLMITIISLMVANKVVFMHSHLLADGSVVTHSHPFNKSGDNGTGTSHSHSSIDFLLISNIDVLFFATVLFSLLIFSPYYNTLVITSSISYKSPFEGFLPGRSPPLS